MRKVPDETPQAETVQWMGSCPCGCGNFYAVLLDKKEKPMAVFGWDRPGWMEFMSGVLEMVGDADEPHQHSH